MKKFRFQIGDLVRFKHPDPARRRVGDRDHHLFPVGGPGLVTDIDPHPWEIHPYEVYWFENQVTETLANRLGTRYSERHLVKLVVRENE